MTAATSRRRPPSAAAAPPPTATAPDGAGKSRRTLRRDERGEVDAVDLALLALILGAAAVALGGPHDALVAAARLVDRFLAWIG